MHNCQLVEPAGHTRGYRRGDQVSTNYIPMYVLTGGPNSGKSSVMSALQSHYGAQVTFIPEVATILLSNGFPTPGTHIEWSPQWQQHFQKAVAATQLAMEATYQVVARQRGHKLIVCDRGINDGKAYLDCTVAEFVLETVRNPDYELLDFYNRYGLVLHLESVAIERPELYGNHTNLSRFEDVEKAAQLDRATRKAWQFSKVVKIQSYPSFEDKIAKVARYIECALVS